MVNGENMINVHKLNDDAYVLKYFFISPLLETFDFSSVMALP